MYKVGIFFWVAKISNIFSDMPDIPDFLWFLLVDAGSKPTHEVKSEITQPPWELRTDI